MLTTELKIGKLYRVVESYSQHYYNEKEHYLLFLKKVSGIYDPVFGRGHDIFYFLNQHGEVKKYVDGFVEVFIDHIRH